MTGRFWPDRDPLDPDGLYWPGLQPSARRPRQQLIRHRHTYPDGTVLHADSQWLPSLGRTLDRWLLHGRRIAVSCRGSVPSQRPDFPGIGRQLLTEWRRSRIVEPPQRSAA